MKLDIRNVDYSISDIKILKDISVSIEEGKFVGIIGPNGSGKSTLIKNICKHIKPTNGSIFMEDIDIKTLNNKKYASKLSVVMQEGESTFDFKVSEVMQMGRYHKKGLFESEDNEDEEIINKCLAQVNLTGFSQRNFLSLSGGERQRVMIARALAQETDIIVLDEPTNHLDIGSQLQSLRLLKNSNKTVVAALHDLSVAAQYCDKIYVLYNGRVIRYGEPRNVIDSELIMELYGVKGEVFTYKDDVFISYS